MRALVVVMLAACGASQDAPTGAECDHVWGQPSGYMASACCRSQTDCAAAGQSSYLCTPPGTPLPSGACPLGDCDVDADCRTTGQPDICQPTSCTPVGGPSRTGICVAGCTADAGCAAGESCDLATNRCHARACATATDCPTDFGCEAGACARHTCASDGDCAGYCVLGHCYQAAGECRGPVG